jgi:predicted dinucleotide-binding enzyme
MVKRIAVAGYGAVGRALAERLASKRKSGWCLSIPKKSSDDRRTSSTVRNGRGIIDRIYAWYFVTNSSLRNAL